MARELKPHEIQTFYLKAPESQVHMEGGASRDGDPELDMEEGAAEGLSTGLFIC